MRSATSLRPFSHPWPGPQPEPGPRPQPEPGRRHQPQPQVSIQVHVSERPFGFTLLLIGDDDAECLRLVDGLLLLHDLLQDTRTIHK